MGPNFGIFCIFFGTKIRKNTKNPKMAKLFLVIPSMFWVIPSIFWVIPSMFWVIPSMFWVTPNVFWVIPSVNVECAT